MHFYLESSGKIISNYEGYYKTDRKCSIYLVKVIVNLAKWKLCHCSHPLFFVHTMRGPNVLLEATTFNWMDNSENILRKGQVWNNMTILNNCSSILCKKYQWMRCSLNHMSDFPVWRDPYCWLYPAVEGSGGSVLLCWRWHCSTVWEQGHL